MLKILVQALAAENMVAREADRLHNVLVLLETDAAFCLVNQRLYPRCFGLR
jgi:hypothetical protein